MLFNLIKKILTTFSAVFTGVSIGAYFLDWFLLKFTNKTSLNERDKR